MPIDTEELILQIHAKVSEINAKLESDYRALYGNGKPGLIADVANLKKEMAIVQAKQSWWGSAIAGWVSVIAWLITTAISIIALIVKVR